MPLEIPKVEIMLHSSGMVDEAITPLKMQGVSFFSYTRIDEDGSRIDLNNNAPAAGHMYYETDGYQSYSAESDPYSFTQNIVYGAALADDPSISLLRDIFYVDNMFILINKKPEHTEVWSFGNTPGNCAGIQFCMQNVDWLTSFCFHFKDVASGLIQKFNQYPLQSPLFEGQKSKIPLPELTINRYYFNKNTYITKQQLRCLQLIARGLTAKEIAIELRISFRTVEKHIQVLKTKFNCRKISELIILAIRYQLPL